SRRMTWALVTPSTTTRWVMYSLKGSSLLGCLPRRYRRVGPSFKQRATVLRSIPKRLAISVFDRPFSNSSRTFMTSSPRSTESPPLGREFGDSGSLRVRIFHSAISRSFASAVLTHFIPATTGRDRAAEATVSCYGTLRGEDLTSVPGPPDSIKIAGDPAYRRPLHEGLTRSARPSRPGLLTTAPSMSSDRCILVGSPKKPGRPTIGTPGVVCTWWSLGQRQIHSRLRLCSRWRAGRTGDFERKR